MLRSLGIVVAFAWLLGAVSGCGFGLGMRAASAQEHHHRHHNDYQGWTNQDGRNCCNNQDCGELKEENERTVRGKLEVRIEGEWCPVLPRHYLKKGNAPNWSSAHVCVQVPIMGDDFGTSAPDPTPVCERLLCYQPRPSS